MSGINRCTFIGNLGQKPEVKFLPSGQAVCEFSIAVNEAWTDKNGEKQEKVEWIRIKAWGKMGENCGKYLDKGRQVYVEGRFTTRSWDDKESGEKRYMTEIVAQNVQFLGGRPDGERGERGDSQEKRTNGGGTSKSGGGGDDFGPPPSDDDIPFVSSDARAYPIYR